jgi:hypothetical protein
MMMRSLGGTAPFRPRADAGMTHGTASAPAASEARPRNRRRLSAAGATVGVGEGESDVEERTPESE